MKKNLALVLALLVFNNAYAQVESAKYKEISTKFVSFYNDDKIDSIVAMFSPEMKAQFGLIKNFRFVRERNATALYETFFDVSVMAMTINLNSQKQIAGLLFKPYTETKPIERNTTKMFLPFKGEWNVTWGGDSKELNYHVESVAQKNAFDILIFDKNGSTHKGTGQSNEDFYAFGKELFAPCDGEVVLVVDGVKDNPPGTTNPIYVPGNTVIIKATNGEYAFLAHFKQNSIVVKQGQKIKSGDLLGQCGNSGNSTEPHIHFHLQNVEDMNIAVGAKCYFDQLKVNGILKSDYSPIKGDKISNINF